MKGAAEWCSDQKSRSGTHDARSSVSQLESNTCSAAGFDVTAYLECTLLLCGTNCLLFSTVSQRHCPISTFGFLSKFEHICGSAMLSRIVNQATQAVKQEQNTQVPPADWTAAVSDICAVCCLAVKPTRCCRTVRKLQSRRWKQHGK